MTNLAQLVLSVRLTITKQFVIVHLDMKEILKLNVYHRLNQQSDVNLTVNVQDQKPVSMPVVLALVTVDHTRNAALPTIIQSVTVAQVILVTHKLDVSNLAVKVITNAPVINNATMVNASTPVSWVIHALQVQSATETTIVQLAVVHPGTSVIHSNVVNVSNVTWMPNAHSIALASNNVVLTLALVLLTHHARRTPFVTLKTTQLVVCAHHI